MIALYAPGKLQERFLREILAPLGMAMETDPSPDGPAPALAVIWIEKKDDETAQRLAATARRTILIAPDRAVAEGVDADTLITPGFRPGAVTDRARTLLVRASADQLPQKLSFADYDFRPQENTVHHKNTNKIQKLTDKERDMLLILIAAEGKSVTRQNLLDSVWAYAPDVETHTLETHIYRLRQKIEEDPASPKILLTDDIGYRILTA